MTDEQIIKALECCNSKKRGNCLNCQYYNYSANCLDDMMNDALDLINRQKAEKEALIAGQETLQKHIAKQKAEIESLYKEVDHLSQCVLYHDGQILDAIKDFAEEFEKRCIASGIYPAVTKNILKNLVKELTEVKADEELD